MGGVRVLVRVQLGPVVEVHRLHGPGPVRVSVHGGRDAHPVHRIVGQVFVLHSEYTATRICQSRVRTFLQVREILQKLFKVGDVRFDDGRKICQPIDMFSHLI